MAKYRGEHTTLEQYKSETIRNFVFPESIEIKLFYRL
jgi:hypothetical protein